MDQEERLASATLSQTVSDTRAYSPVFADEKSTFALMVLAADTTDWLTAVGGVGAFLASVVLALLASFR